MGELRFPLSFNPLRIVTMDLIRINNGAAFSVKEAVTFTNPVFLVPLQEYADYLNGLSFFGLYDKVQPAIVLLNKGEEYTISYANSVFVPEGCEFSQTSDWWVIKFVDSVYKD